MAWGAIFIAAITDAIGGIAGTHVVVADKAFRLALAMAWGIVGMAFIAYAILPCLAVAVVANPTLRFALAMAWGVVGIAFITHAALPRRACGVTHAARGIAFAAACSAGFVFENALAVLPQPTGAVVADKALGRHLAYACSANL